jgi:hypothetical protein
MTVMTLTEQTPVEIDTQIAALYEERYRHQESAQRAWSYVEHYVSRLLEDSGVLKGRDKVTPEQIREHLAEYSEISESEEMQAEAYPQYYVRGNAQSAWSKYLEYLDAAAKADEALMETEPLEEEYVRRGRWNRAFLVTNVGGHVHRSMNCSTCFITTRYHWVVEFSAKSEAEIVEAAGERACTVCYPSAPVEVLSRPTQMFTPTEVEKQKARVEREAKAAAKKAAEIVVEGFFDWRSQPERKAFKSERAVTNAIASNLSSLAIYSEGHPDFAKWESNVEVLIAALAERGVEYDLEKAKAAAAKRAVQ